MDIETTGTALYNAILLRPHDLAPRLAYADWLIENEGEFGQWRGRTIIESIENKSERVVYNTRSGCDWQGLERNGFVDLVGVSIADFMDHSRDIAFVHPVTKWHITDVLPLVNDLNYVIHALYSTSNNNMRDRRLANEMPTELAEIMLDCGHTKTSDGMIVFTGHKEAIDALRVACFQYARIPLLKKFGAGTLRD